MGAHEYIPGKTVLVAQNTSASLHSMNVSSKANLGQNAG